MDRRTFITAAAVGLPVLTASRPAPAGSPALARYLDFYIAEMERDWNDPEPSTEVMAYRQQALALLREVTAENPALAYGWDERGAMPLILAETAAQVSQAEALLGEARLCARRLGELGCPKMAKSMMRSLKASSTPECPGAYVSSADQEARDSTQNNRRCL